MGKEYSFLPSTIVTCSGMSQKLSDVSHVKQKSRTRLFKSQPCSPESTCVHLCPPVSPASASNWCSGAFKAAGGPRLSDLRRSSVGASSQTLSGGERWERRRQQHRPAGTPNHPPPPSTAPSSSSSVPSQERKERLSGDRNNRGNRLRSFWISRWGRTAGAWTALPGESWTVRLQPRIMPLGFRTLLFGFVTLAAVVLIIDDIAQVEEETA